MSSILALPVLAAASLIDLRAGLVSAWKRALLVAVAMTVCVAYIQFFLPLHFTISERTMLWCLPILAATDAATRSISLCALAGACVFSLTAHWRQGDLTHALLVASIIALFMVPLMLFVRVVAGKDALGTGDILYSVWLSIALGITSPVIMGLGAALTWRRREIPLVTFASFAAIVVIVGLAVWGRFPWRS